ncbi:MAG: hypothetical protein IJY70_04070 [Clostridia bacterium]|nr:hypothetical protein [Clostridia bacterium]
MRKKIIAIILTVITSLSLFTGCSLFEYDSERDYMQVIATVKPITITEGAGDDQVSYTEPAKTIYKHQLVSSVNSSAASLVNNYGYTVEQAVDYLVDQLVTTQIVIAEANAQIYFGNIVWGQHEKNEVIKGIFDFIDNNLLSITNEILEERGEPTINKGESAEEESAETTYPTKEEVVVGLYDDMTKAELVEAVLERGINDLSREKVEGFVKYKLIELLENDDLQNEGEWTPDTIRYPGMFGSDDAKSLEREAMRRLLTVLRDSVNDNFRLTENEKATFIKELNDINTVVNQRGISYAYPELGKTQLMKKFVGDDIETNLKLALLQSHITASVEVSEDEVVEHYNTLLASQKSKYATVDNFYTDIKSGSVSPLLYYPNGNYYYVKHILVPFSDEQTSALTAYKNQFQNIVGASGIKEYKNTLGQSTKGYAHKDGENYGDELTIQQIYDDIATQMAVVNADPVAREQKFDELIYKYNTDDGIFGNELGYAVKGNFDDVTDEKAKYDATYMEEFARAADELYRAGVEGALSDIVVTDYGVHILYLSKIIPNGGVELGLNDYISNLNETKVYDKILESKLAEKQTSEFNKWLTLRIGVYQNIDGAITKNADVYADLKQI